MNNDAHTAPRPTNNMEVTMTKLNVDVQMGDVVTVMGAAHTITDEPTFVTVRGQRMLRWVLAAVPNGLRTGQLNGAWDVFPNGRSNVAV
jgi:hypothetical protein